MRNVFIMRLMSCLLVVILATSIFGTVSAESDTAAVPIYYIPESSAQINIKIFNDFYETIDLEKGCSVNLEYDAQGRIIKIIGKTDNIQEVISFTHYEDGTYSQQKTVNVIENNDMKLFSISSNEPLESYSVTEGSYDSKMGDPAVMKRIKAAQEVWINKPEAREEAHIEAIVARADYCVAYPKSPFAELFLEDGELNTGIYFRRTLKNTLPQMYGNDIIALQRALMLYGHLDAADVKNEEYGYFGPSTEAAVKEYQAENGLRQTGIADNTTLKKMFSEHTSNNLSQVSFEDMNQINIFRNKHNLICDALIARLSLTPGDMLKEAYIKGAGLKGNGGRADVVRTGSVNYVWEVKPDSKYGRASGPPQVATYVNRSKDEINSDYYYCPLQYGSMIEPFDLPWDGTRMVHVSSYRNDRKYDSGVVYYRDVKNSEPIWEPALEPVVVPNPQEDYQKVTMPDFQVLYNGLTSTGVSVSDIYITSYIIVIGVAVATGMYWLVFV